MSPPDILKILQKHWQAPVWLIVAFGVLFWFTTMTAPGRRVREAVFTWVSVRVRWPVWGVHRYRARLSRDERFVPLPFRREDDERVALVDVYVEQDVGSEHKTPAKTRIDINTREPFRYLVTGDPGSGKSLLLQSLLYGWADRRHHHRRGRVPVRAVLNRLNPDLDNPLATLHAELTAFFDRRGFGRASRFVRGALRRGRLVLLLDALDEVTPATERHRIELLIKRIVEEYPRCSFVVTCRAAIDSGLSGEFTRLRLCPFDDRQIEAHLRGWESVPSGDPGRVNRLRDALHRIPRLRSLATNPLLLTYMAYVFARTSSTHELPRSRAQFYHRVVDHLLRDDAKTPTEHPPDRKLAFLTRLAVDTMASSRDGAIGYRELTETAKAVAPDMDHTASDRLIREVVDRTGLLQRLDGDVTYVFAHRTIMEYFVALSHRDDPEPLLDAYRRDPIGMPEVIKLWCGITAAPAHELLERIFDLNLSFGIGCLGESDADDFPLTEEVISESFAMIPEMAMGQMQGSFIAALAVLASRDDAIGATALRVADDFLGDGDGDYRRICAVLAESGTDAAARLLLEHRGSYPYAREALVGMGDDALPALRDAIATADTTVDKAVEYIDDIAAIGTPAASRALVGFVRDLPHLSGDIYLLEPGSSVQDACCWRAAWQLAALVRHADCETQLASLEPTSSNSGLPDTEGTPPPASTVEIRGPHPSDTDRVPFDLPWSPFADPDSPGFTELMNIVAALISLPVDRHCPAPLAIDKIDPRLALHWLAARAPDTPNYPARVANVLDPYDISDPILRIVLDSLSTSLLTAFLGNRMVLAYDHSRHWPRIVRGLRRPYSRSRPWKAKRISRIRPFWLAVLGRPGNPLRGIGDEVLMELRRERHNE